MKKMGREAEKVGIVEVGKGAERRGKVVVKAKMKNFVDEELARRGLLKPEEVREVEREALVDIGATMLTLPEEVVDELGLTEIQKVTVRYANNKRELKPVVSGAKVTLLNRSGNFDAVVEVPGSDILIGQIVLEELDLVIDHKTGELMPRPESPDMPLIEILKNKK